MKFFSDFTEILRQDPKYIEDIRNETIILTNRDIKTFLQATFSYAAMQMAFYKLIELFFADFSCEGCCLKFMFNCCTNGKNSSHSESCKIKWNELKLYFFNHYLSDLEVINKIPLFYDEDLDLIDNPLVNND